MELKDYIKEYDDSLTVMENCINLFKQAKNEEKLAHTIKVCETGIEIAKKYGIDQNKVEISCYLHDISAIIPKDAYILLCESNGIKVLDCERKIPGLLHQKVSRLIAEQIFNIIDYEILHAIESHTTLRDKPTGIDMVVFIADKISWDQEGIPPYFERISEAIKESLEKACLEHINYRLENRVGLIPHPMLTQAKESLDKVLNKK